MQRHKYLSFILILTLLLFVLLSCSKKTSEPDVQTVATPTFDPPGGDYIESQLVTITCETLSATIYYTLDGSKPNYRSPVYSGPITLYKTTKIRAKATREGYADSKIASATYTTLLPPQMVYVLGGTFNNGTSDVTLSSFYLDKHQLTQAEYQAVMGTWDSNPHGWGYAGVGSDYPVYYVSWFNAIEYCNRRSLQENLTPCYSYSSDGTNPANWPSGWNSDYNNHSNVSCNWTANGYRLPTEMEWQFALQGGNQTHNYTYSGSNDINAVAWYGMNSGATTHTVGGKLANELGLYDMSGNVWELVWDIKGDYPSGSQNNPTGSNSGSFRVSRGGGWYSSADDCTVSYRFISEATNIYNFMGFRVCRLSP